MSTPQQQDRITKQQLGRMARILVEPGIGIKRWAAVGMAGVLLTALGIAFAVSVSLTNTVVEFGRTLTLGNHLNGVLRGAIFGGGGLLLSGLAAFMLYRRVAYGMRQATQGGGVLESLSADRTRRSGPRIVAIGGGTGLSSLLRGLKQFTYNITAVVTTADNGGSSGRLRNDLGMPPPGDARQCLIALSESEPLMEELLSYRFDAEGALEGHNLGNLLLAALTDTQGSFSDALLAAGSLLAVRGSVVPACLADDVHLYAKTAGGRVLEGETAVGHAGETIEELWLDPNDCRANPAALNAIAEADIIVVGPGSLYTSILPNFLVPGIGKAVGASRAHKVLVCNIATQHGETDDLSAADHLRVFQQHAGVNVTHFLVNSRARAIAPEYHQTPLSAGPALEGLNGALVVADVVSEDRPSRHDPDKLARALLGIARTPAVPVDPVPQLSR